MNPIELVVYIALAYLALGVVVAAFVLLTRATQLDRRLASAPLHVRLILLPGSALFGPLVVVRAIRGSA